MLNKLGDIDGYSKYEIKDGKYMSISYRLEVDKCADIITPEACIVNVTHTGAYGQIKFIFDGEKFSCSNPMSNLFGKILDRRLKEQVIATNEDWSRAIDIKNLSFDRPDIAELHNKYFLGRVNQNYWVELPNI